MTYESLKVVPIRRGEYMLKKYGKFLIILAVFITIFTVGTACGRKSDGDIQILSQSSPSPDSETPVGKSTKQPKASDEDVEENEDCQDALDNKKILPIYCINDTGDAIEMIDTFIDEEAEVDAEFVTEQVVNEFLDQDLTIKIDKVTVNDKGDVIVSFQKDSAPQKGVGKEAEGFILDCISQSILDDVDGSHAVIFQIEGDAYQSSHISLKKNEAYNW